MDESRHPRYRDNEDSRFYKTDRLSPEDTWRALSDELGRVLMDAQRAFWRGRLELDAERVGWWHGAIFGRHFPHDGGRFRRERAFFGVVMDRGRTRQIEGSSPDALRRDLTEVCASFNRGVARLDRLGIGLAEQTRVAAALYAGILRVHPFADGNHRTAFVALSAALWSLGLPAVEFADDKDMTGHDSAVAPALISPDGDRQAVREAARHSDRTREKPRDVRYPKTMENGSHPSNGKRDVAQIARGDRLVDATPESIRALADSAMLLSQGAHRAIEMKRKAGSASLDVPATTGAAQD